MNTKIKYVLITFWTFTTIVLFLIGIWYPYVQFAGAISLFGMGTYGSIKARNLIIRMEKQEEAMRINIGKIFKNLN